MGALLIENMNLAHAKTSQCVGRLRRLEATGVQRRKVTKKNKGDFDVSYPDSAMP